jgi:lysophospholipid acyltransferase (LPLAT)-like uncharacterized protein
VITAPSSPSAVVALWHDAMFSVLAATSGVRDVAVYVLRWPGFEPTVRFIERLGFSVIIGDAGNAYGVREGREWLAKPGRLVAITADGPSGPRRVAKEGVVRLARLWRAALHPLYVSTSRGLRRSDWDRAVMPLPRSRLVVEARGEVPRSLPTRAAATALEEALAASPDRVPPRAPLRDLGYRVWIKACTERPLEGRLVLWPDAK